MPRPVWIVVLTTIAFVLCALTSAIEARKARSLFGAGVWTALTIASSLTAILTASLLA